jgi:hypothetical protein
VDKVWKRFLLGCLSCVAIMVAVCCFVWEGFRLLGYSDPGDAPVLMRYAGLIAIVATMVFVFGLTAGDAYRQLMERREEK